MSKTTLALALAIHLLGSIATNARAGDDDGDNYEAQIVGATTDGTRIVTWSRPRFEGTCTIALRDASFSVVGEYTLVAGQWRFRGSDVYPSAPRPVDGLDTDSCSAAAERIAEWMDARALVAVRGINALGKIRDTRDVMPWTEVHIHVGGVDVQVHRGPLPGAQPAPKPAVQAFSYRPVSAAEVASGHFAWLVVEYNDPFQDRRDCGMVDASDAPDIVRDYGRRCPSEQDSGLVFLTPATLRQTLALQELTRLAPGLRRARALARYVTTYPGDLNARALLLEAVWHAHVDWPTAKALMDIPLAADAAWSPLGPFVGHGSERGSDRAVLYADGIDESDWYKTDPHGEASRFWDAQRRALLRDR